MLNKVPAAPIEYVDDMGSAQAPSMDLLAILRGVLRRWKLVTAIALCVSVATYGVVKLLPLRYKSTVEILVYDPQRQIDTTVQKPISPFVDALGNEAMDTEINVLRSKSVALRVASELGLDRDPEFQPHRIPSMAEWLQSVAHATADLAERLGIAKRQRIADLAERFGVPAQGLAGDNSGQSIGAAEEKAEKLDWAADELLKRVEVWQQSYIIFVSATSRDPVQARRLASRIADDYLASQREARQEALDHVATWLRSRTADLQSRISKTQASIDKLTVESGIRDTESVKIKEQQIGDLNTELMKAREEVNDRRAHLEQARNVIDANGDIDSIPELTASTSLAELRRKKMELGWSLASLQNKMGEHNPQVISDRAALADVNKQINAEAEHILGIMKNAYDIAARREQSLEANLHNLTANLSSETYLKLQQLQREADEDRKVYDVYLAQYNDVAERVEMQYTSARIVSPATLPRSPSTSRMKFYALGGMAGLGGGLLLVFLLEYFRPGVKTSMEIEQSFGLPVVGFIPLVSQRKTRGVAYFQLLHTMAREPFSHLSEAVHAMRVSLELSSANPKVILITSAIPGEGKSTAAMLLAASSASSGKRTILLDCDLRMRSTSEALRRLRRSDGPGLSELLHGTARLEDVIAEDPVTKIHLITAGSMTPNAADLLMSQGMLDLIAVLRSDFDYIVMDAPPLLPVVDGLALATVTDKILVIVEWWRTPRASINEAFRLLGQEANRVAGIVFNKVELKQLPGYGGGQQYRSIAKYYGNV